MSNALNINKKEIARWVKTWKRAAFSLEEVRRNELRSPDYYKRNQELINEMLQYACDIGEVRLSSGLVDQQRVYMRLRERQISYPTVL